MKVFKRIFIFILLSLALVIFINSFTTQSNVERIAVEAQKKVGE